MLEDSISRAYRTMAERNWDKIYIALDIHDTVMEANYKDATGALLPECIKPLQVISNLPEVVIILYSCCHPKDYETYMNVFKSNGIKIGYFNENPNVENTVSGCFDKKFYYSILIDDKAGFNPKDWSKVQSYFLKYRSKTKTLNVNNLVTKTVEWLALILSIVGYVGIADKAVWGFYVWIISNICLGYLAIKNRQSPLLLLYILYTIANIYTIYQWSN